MSAIYLTGKDGIKRVYSFKEILVLHDNEAAVLQRITAIRQRIQDLDDYKGDVQQVIDALPGLWNRAQADPIIDRLEEALTMIDQSKQYYQLLVDHLVFLVECARKASSVEVQYKGKYDFRRDRYLGKYYFFGHTKWYLHLHFTISG